MIRICEIFYSIQGESTFAGRPCTFIRLTGCNLRCSYCDTAYAYEEGRPMSVDEITDRVEQIDCGLVEITGGEPLLQPEIHDLTGRLIKKGYDVLVETNGTIDIDSLPAGTRRIMDIKCPGSGESANTDWQNMNRIHAGDEIKFVLKNREDYEWTKSILRKHPVPDGIPVLFSPVTNELQPDILAGWILEDHLHVRLQLQLHHIIWPDTERAK